MLAGLRRPSRQCAAVSTTLGAIMDPVQYSLDVLIDTTPATDPTAPPATSACMNAPARAWPTKVADSASAMSTVSDAPIEPSRVMSLSLRDRSGPFVRHSG
jgi:hypothetical protein